MTNMDVIGRLAFYAGIVISILLGWMDMQYATIILVVLGLIVGLLNVTAKETTNFLIGTLVLVTAGLTLASALGEPIKSILHAFTVFTAAAAVLVAFKAVWTIQKGR